VEQEQEEEGWGGAGTGVAWPVRAEAPTLGTVLEEAG
jgi:hypothetical protein